MDLSIVTVNWNAYDFARILIESIAYYSSSQYEIIIVDNSLKKEKLNYPHVKMLPQDSNIGHGAGLNLGIREATAKYTLFLDIDCHILTRNWDTCLLQQMTNYQVLGGKGVEVKPIRPACMLLETSLGQKYDFCPTPNYRGHRITPEGFDVAIQAYHQMIREGVKIGFLESKHPNRYGTMNGEEWCVDNTPLIYHHWHGSHLKERQVDFEADLLADKNKLFSQLYWRML